jgi:glycosyltransferase involved in cell wall biosynthesis
MTRSPIGVLELRSVRGTGGGPEKTILLGTHRADRTAFDITVCYLRDARDTVFAIGEHARRLGVPYVEIVERHSLDPSIWRPLRALIRSRRIHIVHSHEYKSDLLAWMLARVDDVVPLATAHGWTGHSSRERRIYYPLDKRLLARFPRVIAVSNDIRRELLRAGARSDRVTTVLNGIDPDAFRRIPGQRPAARAALGLSPDEFVIGSVGRLEPQKRFDLLMRSFAVVCDQLPHRALTLLIAGEGSQRASLTAAAASLGLGARCRLLGQRADISVLHQAFDLFVQSSDYEGTPNAVLEAMALETPVVATDVGGTAELIRREIDGLIVPPGDLDALSAAIVRAIEEPDATVRRTAHARRRVDTDLSFEARMRRVEDVYRELIRQRDERSKAGPRP